jgi:TonB family protein
LEKNLRYAKNAKNIHLKGTIYVLFVVWKDGSIRDAQILRGLGAGLDEEVIRVIGAMPDWKPGLQNGRPVNVRYRVPVTFNLN